MNVKPIDNFMKRYHRAVQSRSQEMRLSMEQANELAAAINELLTKNVELNQSKGNSALSDNIEIVMDGGNTNSQ